MNEVRQGRGRGGKRRTTRGAAAQPAAGASVRDRLVAVAQMRFLRFGVAATGVDDICHDAGVTKGAFFHYFPSKHALVLEALRAWTAAGAEAFAAAPFWTDPDPVQRVLGFVDHTCTLVQHSPLPMGCLLGTVAQEMGGADRAVCTTCAEGFDTWLAPFRQAMHEAAARHAPRAGVDADELVDLFLTIFEGALILGKVRGGDAATVVTQLMHYRRYLESLFAAPPGPKRRKAAAR